MPSPKGKPKERRYATAGKTIYLTDDELTSHAVALDDIDSYVPYDKDGCTIIFKNHTAKHFVNQMMHNRVIDITDPNGNVKSLKLQPITKLIDNAGRRH